VGDGTNASKNVPTLVSGNLKWSLLTIGNAHVCGLTVDDDAYCWGESTPFRFLLFVSCWLCILVSVNACSSPPQAIKNLASWAMAPRHLNTCQLPCSAGTNGR